MSGHLSDIHGKRLMANNPNDLTENLTPKNPVIVAGTTYNRYVIPLLTGSPDSTKNKNTINRILKALKGSGIIHFKPLPLD